MSDAIKYEIAERLARVLEREGFVESAMTMRALLAERDAALAEVARLREALEKIAEQDWVENCLDPQWAARIARAALAKEPPNG